MSIAIDGKTLRRSYDSPSNKKAIHMVSAWAAENFSIIRRLVLNLIKQEKSIKKGIKAKRLQARCVLVRHEME